METLGSRVKSMIADRGESISSFARRVGIDRSRLSRICNGHVEPKAEEIQWIATALDVTVERLLEGLNLGVELPSLSQEFSGLVEKVLQAEAAQREAEERAKVLQHMLDERYEELAGLRHEVRGLQDDLVVERRNRTDLERARRELEQNYKDTLIQVTDMLARNDALSLSFQKSETERRTLMGQLQSVQAEARRLRGALTDAKGAALGTLVLGGILGLAAGGSK